MVYQEAKTTRPYLYRGVWDMQKHINVPKNK